MERTSLSGGEDWRFRHRANVRDGRYFLRKGYAALSAQMEQFPRWTSLGNYALPGGNLLALRKDSIRENTDTRRMVNYGRGFGRHTDRRTNFCVRIHLGLTMRIGRITLRSTVRLASPMNRCDSYIGNWSNRTLLTRRSSAFRVR